MSGLVFRNEKGSRLTLDELDGNFDFLQKLTYIDGESIDGQLIRIKDSTIYVASAATYPFTTTAATFDAEVTAGKWKRISGDVNIAVPYNGTVTPTSTPTGTGAAYWNATQAGIYTNFGGVVVAANSFAFISRSATGVFSISQTALTLNTIDDDRLLKETTLDNYLVSKKQTVLGGNIGVSADTVIWHEGRSGLNFTAFSVDVTPSIDIITNKIEIYASHITSYARINKNVVVKLYSGVSYSGNEPLLNSATLVFSKTITPTEYYINVLQGTDEANIKTVINSDSLKSKVIPFILPSDYALVKNVKYTLFFGVDDASIITSPSTYNSENQIGISSVTNTQTNLAVNNPKYFNKTTKWQSITNNIPFRFIKTSFVDHYSNITETQFLDLKKKNVKSSLKESKTISKEVTKISENLSVIKVWKETDATGIAGFMTKIQVKKDFIFDSIQINPVKFDDYTNKEVDIVIRIYKNLTSVVNQPDFTTGVYLGESIMSYKDYYNLITKGATKTILETTFLNDTIKSSEILFEFDNSFSVVNGDIIFVVVTGVIGDVFTGGLPSSQLLGMYSTTKKEDLITNCLSAYYLKQNTTSWQVLPDLIPMSLNVKTSVKNYTTNPFVPNNTEISTIGSKHFINSKLKSFYDKFLTKTTPLNVCLIGSSISNIQNFGTELTYDETNLPMCLYNPNTYISYLWRLLNKGALNQDYSLKSNVGNMEFIKANHATKVTKTGTWESNWNGVVDTKFSKSGGSVQGRHEFFYTKDKGYIEFTIDKASTGFSVVCDKFSGTRTNGTTALSACNSMKISVDGVEVSTVSLIGTYSSENIRFDFNITPTTSNRVIRIENTQIADSWINIHGIEAWKGKSVRVINNAVNGGSTEATNINFNTLVQSSNPDLVVYEHTMLNDFTINIETVEANTRSILDKIKLLNLPILIFVTHITDRGSNDASKVTSWVDYPLNTTIKYNLALPNMLKKVCAEYDIPYIDVAQYLFDKDGLDFIPLNYTYDGTHLKQEGHDVYKYLIDKIFKL